MTADLPRLTRPRAEIERTLDAQIGRGQELAAECREVQHEGQFRQAEADFATWTNRNELQLRRLFTGTELLAQYHRATNVGIKRVTTWRDSYTHHVERLQASIEALRTILANLDLYDEVRSVQAASTADERDRYLRALFELAGGRAAPMGRARIDDVLARSGIREGVGDDVEQYLIAEGVIELIDMGTVGLTHRGRQLLDAGSAAPHRPEEAQRIVNNFITAHGGAIQVAGDNAFQRAEVVSADETTVIAEVHEANVLHALPPLIAEFRAAMERSGVIDAAVVAEAEGYLATVEAQAASPKPNRSIMRSSLEALGDIARTGVGSAAGIGLAEAVKALAQLL